VKMELLRPSETLAHSKNATAHNPKDRFLYRKMFEMKIVDINQRLRYLSYTDRMMGRFMRRSVCQFINLGFCLNYSNQNNILLTAFSIDPYTKFYRNSFSSFGNET
jgi:hypothetical protein